MNNPYGKLTILLCGASLLAACERPPVDVTQIGYRGVGMEQVSNPRTVAALKATSVVPEALPPAPADGPTAGEIYENVQVLGDLSIAEFTRIMQAMTEWVSPEEGCNYCHVGDNLADDNIYTKVVSRRMIQMTRHINSDWQDHVGETGVTCYTCHRGQNIPANVWFGEPEPAPSRGALGNRAGQNAPMQQVGLSSLPHAPFANLLGGAQEIRVVSNTALPAGNEANIKDTERTYGLMIHMSESLGVNCTYCHNTRSFSEWDQSTPQRATSWYGIRMARDLNDAYLVPLTSAFPETRLGPAGDVAKINCTTCHQGVYKPLHGVSMLADYPELRAARPPRPPTPTEDVVTVEDESMPAPEG